VTDEDALLRYGRPGKDIVREVVMLPSHYCVCVVVRRCVYSVSWVL